MPVRVDDGVAHRIVDYAEDDKPMDDPLSDPVHKDVELKELVLLTQKVDAGHL